MATNLIQGGSGGLSSGISVRADPSEFTFERIQTNPLRACRLSREATVCCGSKLLKCCRGVQDGSLRTIRMSNDGRQPLRSEISCFFTCGAHHLKLFGDV